MGLSGPDRAGQHGEAKTCYPGSPCYPGRIGPGKTCYPGSPCYPGRIGPGKTCYPSSRQSVLSGHPARIARAGQYMLSGQSVPSGTDYTDKTNRASRATRALGKRGGVAIPAQPSPDSDRTGAVLHWLHRQTCGMLAVSAISATRGAQLDPTSNCVPRYPCYQGYPDRARQMHLHLRAYPCCPCWVLCAVRPPGLRTRQPWCWCSAAVRAVSACNWCGTIRDPDSALTDPVSMTASVCTPLHSSARRRVRSYFQQIDTCKARLLHFQCGALSPSLQIAFVLSSRILIVYLLDICRFYSHRLTRVLDCTAYVTRWTA
jgi:hypothetical protein